MADPMKIRATLQGDVVDVRVLMAHPMETGQRKADGKAIPLHFIQTITAQLNGKTVFSADISQAVSRNPVFAFKVKGDGKIGYTTVFKVELKNTNKQVGRYYVTNVTDQWQDMVIPLKDFKGINDFSNLTEFVIVFEDRIASNKKGVIYIDDIKFVKSK